MYQLRGSAMINLATMKGCHFIYHNVDENRKIFSINVFNKFIIS